VANECTRWGNSLQGNFSRVVKTGRDYGNVSEQRIEEIVGIAKQQRYGRMQGRQRVRGPKCG